MALPASCKNSAKRIEESGDISDGLSTQVQPASKAGTAFRATCSVHSTRLIGRKGHVIGDLIHRPVPWCYETHNADCLQRYAIIWRVRAERTQPLHAVECFQKVVRVPWQARRLAAARTIDGGAQFGADCLGHLFGSGRVFG